MPPTDLAALQGAGLKNGAGSAELNLPSTTSVGFDWKIGPTFSLQGEYARTTWSSFKTLVVKFTDNVPPQTTESITDESWNDTTFVSLGGTWKLNQEWTLRAGLAFDQSAVDDAHRTPRIPDNDRKWISFGGTYIVSKKTAIDFGYTRIIVADGKVMLSAGTTATDPNATRGNLNGHIHAAINILGAQVRYSF